MTKMAVIQSSQTMFSRLDNEDSRARERIVYLNC